jgi:SPP1 family predicted phage head-tail adaptor
MNAGKLTKRVRLEAEVRFTDEGGGASTGWALVAEVFAAVVPLQGAERVVAMQLAANLTHRVEIRYRSGMDERMRVVYEGRVFGIAAVLDLDERHDEIHLLCEERR